MYESKDLKKNTCIKIYKISIPPLFDDECKKYDSSANDLINTPTKPFNKT